MRLLWLSCVLCNFCFVCAAAPVLSPPRDASIPARGKTGGNQSNPLVVNSQNGFLLLWIHRDRGSADYLQPSRLLAMRVDTNGAPLETAPIVVSESPSLIEGPALTSDGTNYVLAWLDGRGSNYLGLRATMVTSSGIVAVTNGILLNALPNGNRPIRLVGGAEGSFLLWMDLVSNEVRGARISPAGVVLDPSGVPMNLLPGTEGALGSDGSNHIFVASQYEPVSATSPTFRWRIAQANATVSSAAKIAEANTAADDFSLAFNGSRFLLTTHHGASNVAYFLNPDGTLLVPGPALRDGFRWHRATSSRGEFFILNRHFSDELEFARYSGTGALLATNTLQFSLNLSAEPLDYSFASGLHVSILFRREPNNNELLAYVVRPDGSVWGQFSPQGPNQQHAPVVVSDGAGYLVAWSEERDGSNIVYAVRTDPDGNPLPPGPLAGGEGYDVHAAYSSGVFLLIWARDDFSILGRRLSGNGSWLDPAPVVLRTSAFHPAVASSSSNFLFAWDMTTTEGLVNQEVHGTFLGINALPGSGPSFKISNFGPRIQSSPEITFNGSNYVVAWNAYQLGFFYSFVAWRSISPDGELLSQSGSTPTDSSTPLLTGQGNTAWLSWYDFLSGYRLAQLSTNGSGQIPYDGVPLNITPAALASLGSNVWVAGTISIFDPNFTRYLAFAAYNSPSNLTVAPFRLETGSDQPSLASNGTNLLVAYRSPNLSFDHPGTPRIRVRALYPETTLRLVQTVGLRLTGSAQHPFLIEQSTDLILWQPFRTNSGWGSFDYPVPAGTKQFFRLRWYPP